MQFTGQALRAFPHILIFEVGKYQVLILRHDSTMDLLAILVSLQKAPLLEFLAFFVSQAVVDSAAQSESFPRLILLWTLDISHLPAFLYFRLLVLIASEALTIEKLFFQVRDTIFPDFVGLSLEPGLGPASTKV